MINDWRKEIATAWLVKQSMMKLDTEKIYEYHLPEVAASQAQVAEVESHLGFHLDPHYRAFLLHSNGWRRFLQSTDLFGTEELLRGPKNACGQFLLSMLDDGLLIKSSLKRNQLLPIAASDRDRDLCVITHPNSTNPGMVIWFGGEEIERFQNFDDYFLAMVDYNRLEVRRFMNEHTDADQGK